MTIDTYLFDLGKVLIDFDQSKLIKNLSGLLQVDSAIVASFLASGIQQQYETGLISTKDLYAEFSRLSSSLFTLEQLSQAACDIFTPINGTVEIVKQLRRMNKRLVIVSNTSELHKEHCVKHFDFLSLFDRYIFSYEIFAMKPAPEFYQAAFEAADAPLENCLFIDDLAENVKAASDFGFKVHHFTKPSILQSELFS